MPERKLYRLEVTEEAYHAVEAEAFLFSMTMKEVASRAVMVHVSLRAKQLAVERSNEHRDEKTLDHVGEEDKRGAVADSEKSEKSKPKSKLDPKVIAQIKESWVSTHNRSEISRQTGIERAKVSRYVTRLINDGELKE